MRLWLSAEAGFALGGQASAALIDGAQLKVYPGAPHGITDTHKEQLGAALLEFLNGTNERAADESRHVHA
jgi:pimeloyl-ACP methyl ester carboxylesterase